MLINRLKSIRHKHEMNQREFAQLLEIDPAQLSRWERQQQQPVVESAFKICKKLNITMEQLFDYEEDS